MPIRFACAQCDARVKTPDGSEGKKMKCPRCGHLQRVPEKGAAPPPEKAEEPVTEPEASPPPAEEDAATPAPEPKTDAETVPTPAPPQRDSESSDDALGELAAAGSEQAAPSQSSREEDQVEAAEPPAERSDQAEPPAPRSRPTPKPRAQGQPATPDAPKAIPLSAHRPRPMPQPKPAANSGESSSGSALSAQVLSATPAAAEARGRSLDLREGELPRARTRRQIARIRAQLQVIVWFCRVIAVVIAGGAVELMLHAGRQNASVLTQAIFLAAGLAAAGLAVAVGQIAAKLRQSLTGS
jgi:hypothetical protein